MKSKKIYTLNLTIEEHWTQDEETEGVDINDYVRGVFTSLDKAIDGANSVMESDEDDTKGIFIMEYDTDKVSSGRCVVGWLNENGKFWKYFEVKDEKHFLYNPDGSPYCSYKKED